MPIPSSGASVPPAGQAPSPRPGTTLIAGFAAGVGSPRNVLFLFLVVVSLIVFWTPLSTLLDYAQRPGQHQYDKYSHILLIPFISMVLVFWQRKRIFASVQYGFRVGAIFLLAGLMVNGLGAWGLSQLGAENSLSLRLLSLVAFWMGGFIFCYGTQAFRAGAFPLLFLLLTVPIPNLVLDVPLAAVRYGSSEVCSLILSLSGVPFLRNGYEFTLPGLTMEVAKECSGIHSTLALFIVSLVAGYVFLTSLGKKVLLILFVLPVVCITNGLRIAVLALLTVYVDPRFIHSSLHRDGGIGFFLLALLILFPIVRLLGRRERVREP